MRDRGQPEVEMGFKEGFSFFSFVNGIFKYQ